ncbi:NADH-quinone oxidoreductase subunit C [Streptomyces sp. ET3-23]|uniref:NADH-quinone oxidoreductase subunit C n=1 Tax=Streptomyces sp. ET3-23 TaxID=2885643 RepID=UPI001D10DE9E|nr:NADH-quinone oxidoreductase subunit C [Streptomyces sp. ET3-23]MCC2279719.1 NADH-quinone oxidoreductase subunit C [Streptomyces sp. ET3-23]
MTAVGWLPEAPEELFGEGATAEEAYGLLTVDVPAESWITALETARDRLGCTFFDWLSAVDEPGTGFRVCAHVVGLAGGVHRLLVRTTVPHEAPVLPTAVGVYAGAEWHERETHEMFGVDFTGHPHLVPLLLPEGFEGHPLRKDFVLAARVAKAWPGAKEPGEPAEGGPKRRQMLPPGVPDPNEWGPLKGQLPPAPARPARAARTPGASTDRPVRRTRTAGEGSASQAAEAPVRRARSASEGSASQAAEAPVRRTRSASEGSASQAAAAPARRTRSAADGSASQQPATAEPRSSDAPWHHARPAFDSPERPEAAEPHTTPAPEPAPGAGAPAAAPEPPSGPAAGEPAEPRTPDEPAAGEPAGGPAPGGAGSSPERDPESDPEPAAGEPAAAPEPRTPDRPAAGEPAGGPAPGGAGSSPERDPESDPEPAAGEPRTPTEPAAGESGEPRQNNPAGGDTV